MLQLREAEYHNIGPFRDFKVDLSKFDDALLIAICGENGVGKTFFLETAFGGAMYRSMPTQGTLVKRAVGKDSWFKSTLVNGKTWTFRHVLDGVTGKSEALVLDEQGKPVLSDSKVRSFDAWVAKHCPSPEVIFASLFAAQASGGFLMAKPGERKAILLRVLGIERLELLAARAREHVRDARAALDTLLARIEDEKKRLGVDQPAVELWNKMHPEQPVGGPSLLAAMLREARAESAATEQVLFEARSALENVRAEAVLHEQRVWEAEAIRSRRTELQGRVAKHRADVTDTEERIANNQKILVDAEKIRTAETQLTEFRSEAAKLETSAKAHEEARLVAVRERDGHERARIAAEGRAEAARARQERAEKRLADREKIEEAARFLPARRADLAAAKAAHDAAAAALEALRGERLSGAAERIAHLRKGHEVIEQNATAGTAGYLQGLARATLRGDDTVVEASKAFPSRVRDAELAVVEARDLLSHEETAVQRFEALAARVGELAAAEQEAKDAGAAGLVAVEEADASRVARDVAHETAGERETRRAAARARMLAVEKEIAVLVPLAARATNLAEAKARIATHTQRLESLRSELAQIETDMAGTPEPPPSPPAPDVAGHLSRAEAAETEARRSAAAIGPIEQRVADARASEERLAALTSERAALEADLSEWTRLSNDLGRDGIQALEVDAAGPELTEMVNDLLHSCFGTRWTISIETTRLSADGKRQLEGCEVMVLDTLTGRTAEASDFSGGEKAILETATSLGLMMLACKRTGAKDCTLVRDESGAAVSKGNVRAYVAMLRRAAKQVGAKHVLIVSHVPEVIELCDARLPIPGAAA